MVWIVAAIALLVLEMFVLDLTPTILAGSSGTAALSNALGAPIWLQVTVFVVVALLGLLAIRPLARKHLKLSKKEKTGVDRLPGMRARTLSVVTIDGGLIALDGEQWSAKLDRYVSTEPVPRNEDVVVMRIEGATAIVHPA